MTNTGSFESSPEITATLGVIAEASGMAASEKNAGSLWIIEDSGNPPSLILWQKSGKPVIIPVANATNVDWEDLVLTDGNLYIGDIGDNDRVRNHYTIYQLAEPDADNQTIPDYKTIHFKYPDGSHDAEAFLIDPLTNDIFIITKSDAFSGVYKLSYPFSYTDINTLSLQTTLRYAGVTSAAISPDGLEIIVKTYLNIFHYTNYGVESLDKTLRMEAKRLAYLVEPQGEAVTFAIDNTGFYTLSEKGVAAMVNLYFYKRI